jgi:hypothetical protein
LLFTLLPVGQSRQNLTPHQQTAYAILVLPGT